MPAQAPAPLLELDGVSIRFGGLVAVRDLSLSLAPGELVGLIGPNGAGKTTVFNIVTGQYPPTSGTVRFDGTVINGWPPHRIAALGIARTFQNIRLFAGLSVLENVLVGFHVRRTTGVLQAALRVPAYRREEARGREAALELLERVGLAELALETAGNLPYGQQRRLEIARALATGPRLLLLDEPAAGMNPEEIRQLMAFISGIHEAFDLTVLLIEHHMQVVMGICQRIYVLDYGEVIAHGPPAHIQQDPRVIAAYLGEEGAAVAR